MNRGRARAEQRKFQRKTGGPGQRTGQRKTGQNRSGTKSSRSCGVQVRLTTQRRFAPHYLLLAASSRAPYWPLCLVRRTEGRRLLLEDAASPHSCRQRRRPRRIAKFALVANPECTMGDFCSLRFPMSPLALPHDTTPANPPLCSPKWVQWLSRLVRAHESPLRAELRPNPNCGRARAGGSRAGCSYLYVSVTRRTRCGLHLPNSIYTVPFEKDSTPLRGLSRANEPTMRCVWTKNFVTSAVQGGGPSRKSMLDGSPIPAHTGLSRCTTYIREYQQTHAPSSGPEPRSRGNCEIANPFLGKFSIQTERRHILQWINSLDRSAHAGDPRQLILGSAEELLFESK